MRAAWMHARSQWRTRSGSLVGIALLIALGTAASFTALAGARRSAGVVHRFLEADRTADVIVNVEEAPASTVDAITHLPEVADASVIASMAAFPENAGDAYYPLLASIDGKAGFTTSRGVVIEGRRADPRAADEVMLSEVTAKALHKRAGDVLILRTLSPHEKAICIDAPDQDPSCDRIFKSPSGPRLTTKVVAVGRGGADLRNRPGELSVSFLTPAFYERYGRALGAPGIITVRLHDRDHIDSFVKHVQAVVPDGVEPLFDVSNLSPVEDAVRVLSIGLLLFALVAALAATVAVLQALVRHSSAESATRAVLRTLGATRVTRDAAGALTMLPAALAGVVAGVVVAYFASDSMPIGIARQAESVRGRQFDVLVLLGGSLVVVLGTVAMAVASAHLLERRALSPLHVRRRLPATAITTSVPRSVGLRLAFAPGPSAVPARVALGAIAVAMAGIVAVLAFGGGLRHLLDTPSMYGWGFDAIGIDDARLADVRADPDVIAVAKYRAQLPLRVNDKPTVGFAVEPIVGDIGPSLVAGRAPRARDEVALGVDTMHRAGVRIGDTVRISGTKSGMTMRVTGEAVFPTDTDGYPMADGGLVDPGVIEELGRGDSFSGLAVRVRPGADAVYERLQKFIGPDSSLSRPAPPSEVEKLRQVDALPRVLAAFLAVLGIVAVAHALIVSVRRRRRDFGVLRALG